MKKILIVDDLKSILMTLEAILQKEGYYVSACTNSIDALDRFTIEHFDLMITDAIMPAGANGYTLISTIRSGTRNRDIPIIMLTGKREKADIERALNVGANDYIVKPIDPDLLVAKVKSILHQTESTQSSFATAAVSAHATVALKTDITSISENEIKFTTNYQLTPGQMYRFSSDFFKNFEIESVNARITGCHKDDRATNGFHVAAQFIGLTDSESSKIRVWVRKKLSGV
ncbi:MAG: response regulator [Moraxellaceae bacterium]|nr:response regulator [Pseudobdellovibrionaceae bacterium]